MESNEHLQQHFWTDWMSYVPINSAGEQRLNSILKMDMSLNSQAKSPKKPADFHSIVLNVHIRDFVFQLNCQKAKQTFKWIGFVARSRSVRLNVEELHHPPTPPRHTKYYLYQLTDFSGFLVIFKLSCATKTG